MANLGQSVKFSLTEMLALHSLSPDDEFIIVSVAKDSDDAVLHFRGDEGLLMELLKMAASSIKEIDQEPRLH